MEKKKHIQTVIDHSEDNKRPVAIRDVFNLQLQRGGETITLTGETDAKPRNISDGITELEKINFPRFEKVPYEQFKKDFLKFYVKNPVNELNESFIHDIYDNISLPKRSTSGSAGYDFVTPFNISMVPRSSIMIPTGIRCYMPKQLVLMIYPRSGLSSKNRVFIVNTTPIIDSDYYDADNYGHIFLKLCYDFISNPNPDSPDILERGYFRMTDSVNIDDYCIAGRGIPDTVTYLHSTDKTVWVNENTLKIKAGDRIAQGIFSQYFITYDDYKNGDNLGKRTGGHGSTGK